MTHIQSDNFRVALIESANTIGDSLRARRMEFSCVSDRKDLELPQAFIWINKASGVLKMIFKSVSGESWFT